MIYDAQTLAARGERERAREQAARALELSREHGCRLFEPRAAAIVEAGRASAKGLSITLMASY